MPTAPRRLAVEPEDDIVSTFGAADVDAARVIVTNPAGNVVIAGEFRDAIDFGCPPIVSNGGGDGFIVELTLKDGRQLRHHTKAVRGTAHNPMTRAEVDEKCYSLLAPVLGKRRARELCDTAWNLDKLKNVRELRPLLQA